MGIIYRCDYLECNEMTDNLEEKEKEWVSFYSHSEKYFYLCPRHAMLFDFKNRNRKLERKLDVGV